MRGRPPGTALEERLLLITPGPSSPTPVLKLTPNPDDPMSPMTTSPPTQPTSATDAPQPAPSSTVAATSGKPTSSVHPSGNPPGQVISANPTAQVDESTSAYLDKSSSIHVNISVENSPTEPTKEAQAHSDGTIDKDGG